MNITEFWDRVDRSNGEGACWPWLSCKGTPDYGTVNINLPSGSKKRLKAHRLAYTLTRGSIPKGIIVCHKCDNPPCCNPAHLFLGTPADNSADMCKKGRHLASARPLPNGTYTVGYGETYGPTMALSAIEGKNGMIYALVDVPLTMVDSSGWGSRATLDESEFYTLGEIHSRGTRWWG